MQFYNFLPWSHQLQDLETYFCRTWFRIIVHGVNIDGTWSLWEVTIWFHQTQVSYLLFVFLIIMAMITMMIVMMLAMQIIIIWWKEERGGGRTLLLHCSSSQRSEPLRTMSLTSSALIFIILSMRVYSNVSTVYAVSTPPSIDLYLISLRVA